MPIASKSPYTAFSQVGRYLDQPMLSYRVGKAMPAISLGAASLVMGINAFNAPTGKHKESLLKDGIVLSSIAAGSLFLAEGLKLMPLKTLEECKDVAKTFASELANRIKETPALKQALASNKETRITLTVSEDNPVQLTRKALHETVETVKQHLTGSDQEKEEIIKALFSEETPDPDELLHEEISKARNFFVVGAGGILSGIGGGWLANKLTGKSTAKNNQKMVKEGIFQFMANIGMCAVGAIGGLMVAGKVPQVNKLIRKQGLSGKLLKFGLVTSGLFTGMFGGGHLANVINRNVVSPFFNWTQNTTQSTGQKITQVGSQLAFIGGGAGAGYSIASQATKLAGGTHNVWALLAKMTLPALGAAGGALLPNVLKTSGMPGFKDRVPMVVHPEKTEVPDERKVELADFAGHMGHLDDLSLAAALMGAEILEPFNILCFAYSAYRAGSGYSGRQKEEALSISAKSMPKSVTSAQPLAVNTLVQPQKYVNQNATPFVYPFNQAYQPNMYNLSGNLSPYRNFMPIY
ncbi:MAG: hypothetical protein AAGI66_09860 [Cyanobacteria bacterium P01_H01_bin.74]